MRKSNVSINPCHQGILRQMMLTLLMLLPFGAWAVNYNLSIAGVQVTDANATGITSGDITGTVTFTPASTDNGNINTLTLIGASITGDIIWHDKDDLTIALEGNCSIEGCIQSPSASKLTFKKTRTDANCSFSMYNPTGYSVIREFDEVIYDEVNLATSEPAIYGNDNGNLPKAGLYRLSDWGYAIIDAVITSATPYPLWVGGVQVTTDNENNITGRSISTLTDGFVKYDKNSNTLKMSWASLSQKIVSGLDQNLTIEISGTNTIDLCSQYDTAVVIRATTSDKELHIKKMDDYTTLTIRNFGDGGGLPVVSGFTSINLTDLNIESIVPAFYIGADLVNPANNNHPINDVCFTSYLFYPLWIGYSGIQVTGQNQGDILAGISTAMVSFEQSESGINTLTLNGFQDDLPILSGLDNLTIAISGDNTPTSSSGDRYIQSFNPNATLTFKSLAAGSELGLEAMSESIFRNFKSVDYTTNGLYLMSDHPVMYTKLNGINNLIDPTNDSGIVNATITTTPYYPLWLLEISYINSQPNITYTQVHSGNYQNIINTDPVIASFAPASNTLSLSWYAGNYSLVSGLDNLNLDFSGGNSLDIALSSPDDKDRCILSTNPNATLTITCKNPYGGGGDMLELLNSQNNYSNSVISGFAYVTTGEGAYWDSSSGPITCSGGELVDANSHSVIHSATLTSDPNYSLWVEGTLVTDNNKNDVFGTIPTTGTATVSFEQTTSGGQTVNTLKLNGYTSTYPIISDLDNLTIEFTGTNNLNDTQGYIKSNNPNANLTLKSGSTGSLLTFSNTISNTAAIMGFADVLLDGAYFSSSTPFSYDKTNKKMSGIYGDLQNLTVTTTETYPLWVEGAQVEADNLGWYDPTSNILTMGPGYSPVYSGLSSLKIAVNDATSLESIQFYPTSTDNGTLEIIKDPNCNSGWGLNLNVGHFPDNSRIAGFTSVEFNGFMDFSSNQAHYDTSRRLLVDKNNNPIKGEVYFNYLQAPAMSCDYHPYLILDNNNIDYFGNAAGTLKYSVTYPDGSPGITDAVYDASNKPLIEKAAIITAYATVNGVNSETVTGKYFEFAENSKVYTFTGTEFETAPEVVPAIETTDGVTLQYTVLDLFKDLAEVNGATGKVRIKSYGCPEIQIKLVPTPGTTPYTILNPGSEIIDVYVDIVPPAPTIAYNGTKQYLDTDVLGLTGVGLQGTDIIYTWDTSLNLVLNDYIYFKDLSQVSDKLLLYDPQNSLIQSGTLRAWSVYEEGGHYRIGHMSSQTFSVKKDIASCTVADIASQVYSGTALTPTVTVSSGGSALVAGTDYTVSYKQGGNAVNSLVNTGTYDVTITGIGNYGGTNSKKTFTISQADLANVTIAAIADQTYTGSALEPVPTVTFNNKAVATDEYTVGYASNTEVGTATVTLTSTNKNFSTAHTKSATFKINMSTITANMIGFEDGATSATYYTEVTDYALPEGLLAYIITDVNGSSLTAKRISYIPKGVAVLVEKGTSSETTVDINQTNKLTGVKTAKDVSSITGGTVYALYKDVFYKTISGTIPANRCYLLLSGGAAARSLTVNHDGRNEETAISDVEMQSPEGDDWYSLDGRKINSKPKKKGLYIRNGKKVVIK